MKIISKNVETVNDEKVINYFFDEENIWVGIRKDSCSWEYQEDEDDESYLSGNFVVDGCCVIDYDGCYELPNSVCLALTDLGYTLDL